MDAVPELIVIGSGGLAKEAAQLARRMDPDGRRWRDIAYCAAAADELGRSLPFGAVRYVDADLLARSKPADVAIGIGEPAARRRVATMLERNPALSFPNLLHPSVELDGSLVRLGRGNILCQGVTVTCDIEIGDFNVLGWHVTVGHDARIGSFNVINPSANVSGGVHIGDGCLLGTGSQVLEQIRIADGVRLGAGAVLTRNADRHGATLVGVPARPRS
jgi:sugar O-acyltransferase (sialic acid O-acetyltransferase NeuD family)